MSTKNRVVTGFEYVTIQYKDEFGQAVADTVYRGQELPAEVSDAQVARLEKMGAFRDDTHRERVQRLRVERETLAAAQKGEEELVVGVTPDVRPVALNRETGEARVVDADSKVGADGVVLTAQGVGDPRPNVPYVEGDADPANRESADRIATHGERSSKRTAK